MKPERSEIRQQVARALAEDVGSGDISAMLLQQEALRAVVVCREKAILCGCDWADEAFHQVDESVRIQWHAADGDAIEEGCKICELTGNASSLVTAERTALNFLQFLSGVATKTQRCVALIADSGAQLLDTRKTIPGLRNAQKYAVQMGGGKNHRMGLYDAYLIKENHLANAAIADIVQLAREAHPDKMLEIEVETLEQLKEAIEAQVDRVLLDNFSVAEIQQAVAVNAGRINLEISGNITEESLQRVANCGVDYISLGELTKHVRAIDMSMRLFK